MNVVCEKCGGNNSQSDNFCLNCGSQIYVFEKFSSKTNFNFPIITKTIKKIAFWLLGGIFITHLVLHLIFTFLINDAPSVFDLTEFLIYLGQSLLSGGFLWYFYQNTDSNQYEMDEISYRSYNQFLKTWASIWLTWIILYGYFALMTLLSYKFYISDTTIKITIDLLNLANSFNFIYIFLVLDMKSVNTFQQPNRNQKFKETRRKLTYFYLLIFALTSLCRSLFPQNSEFYIFGVFLSGSVVAVSMSFFSGRLDSHYIDVERRYLILFYFYAVIQPFGPFLLGITSPNITSFKYVFFGFAFALKIYIFLMVDKWIKAGIFELYFVSGCDSVENNSSNT